MSRLKEPIRGPFLPFIRMHQLSSELHLSIQEPLSEEAFQGLLSEYDAGNVELFEYPTPYHPDLHGGDGCEHPRHPIIVHDVWASHTDIPLYTLGTLCPVCSVREKLWVLTLVNEIWDRHRDRNNPFRVRCTKLWHRIRAYLATETLRLEQMVSMEKDWDTQMGVHFETPASSFSEHTQYWSAGAALAILEYAHIDLAIPNLNTIGKDQDEDEDLSMMEIYTPTNSQHTQDPFEEIDPDIDADADNDEAENPHSASSSSTPKLKPALKKRKNSTGERITPAKRPEKKKLQWSPDQELDRPTRPYGQTFWRGSPAYVPGAHSASEGSELEDHSFMHDPDYKWLPNPLPKPTSRAEFLRNVTARTRQRNAAVGGLSIVHRSEMVGTKIEDGAAKKEEEEKKDDAAPSGLVQLTEREVRGWKPHQLVEMERAAAAAAAAAEESDGSTSSDSDSDSDEDDQPTSVKSVVVPKVPSQQPPLHYSWKPHETCGNECSQCKGKNATSADPSSNQAKSSPAPKASRWSDARIIMEFLVGTGLVAPVNTGTPLEVLKKAEASGAGETAVEEEDEDEKEGEEFEDVEIGDGAEMKEDVGVFEMEEGEEKAKEE